MQAWIDEYAQCCMLIKALGFFPFVPRVWDESVCHASDGSFSLDTHDFVFDEIRERHGPKLLINRGTVIQFFTGHMSCLLNNWLYVNCAVV
jgi:hypothetical protein